MYLFRQATDWVACRLPVTQKRSAIRRRPDPPGRPRGARRVQTIRGPATDEASSLASGAATAVAGLLAAGS